MRKGFGPRIICPKCGRHYLPGEIYIPNNFVGQPKYIEKDCYGKILFAENGDMDLKEVYTCDNCNTTFKVVATVQFKTMIKEELNVNTPYSIKLKPQLNLREE